eukprot:jgi/Bigna1/89490/estExt_fgenesh1_pg.C_500053
MSSCNRPRKEAVKENQELKGLQPSFDRCEACGSTHVDGWCDKCCSAEGKIHPYKAHFKMSCPFCPKSITIGRPENSRRPGYDCFTMMRHVGKYCKGTAKARKNAAIKSKDVAGQLPQLLRLTKSVYNSKAAEAVAMDIDDGDGKLSTEQLYRTLHSECDSSAADERQYEASSPLLLPLDDKLYISRGSGSSIDGKNFADLPWQKDADEYKPEFPPLENTLEKEEGSWDLSPYPHLRQVNTTSVQDLKLPDERFSSSDEPESYGNKCRRGGVEKEAGGVGQDVKLSTTVRLSSQEFSTPLSSHAIGAGEESTSAIINDIGMGLSQLKYPNLLMLEEDVNRWF